MTPTDPPKDSLLSSPGEVLHIKQEPEDPQANLGSLGLQEITLDDGRKLLYSLINQPAAVGLKGACGKFAVAVSLDSMQF